LNQPLDACETRTHQVRGKSNEGSDQNDGKGQRFAGRRSPDRQDKHSEVD